MSILQAIGNTTLLRLQIAGARLRRKRLPDPHRQLGRLQPREARSDAGPRRPPDAGASLACIAGGISGAHLGVEAIPAVDYVMVRSERQIFVKQRFD